VRNFKTNFQQYRPKKSSLIIGQQKVMEAIRNGEQIERIYLSNSSSGKFADELKQLANERQIPINKVPIEKINSFNADGHGGCVAVRGKIKYQDLQTVISFEVDNGNVPLFLILDGITDIRNIGALARTAYCCGVQAMIIPDKGVGALNEDAIATSAGALELISVCRVNSLVKAVEELHLNGIKVYASEMNVEKNLFNIDLKEPCAIIMGSEDKGIAGSLLKASDDIFKIPMVKNFNSLNVSVAGGMILYEAMKQRM
jgi:23S rRNA (guanosine2251-2'-O)-methyltransferase